ncbi:MAG: hypothetical protein DMENIID0002_07940 [Rickettsia endosymbiont of Sergentomyia squamirostris]|uniref:Uncharacterized protein n=1 Tax=Candidatus Tisiphia endosymbiont of Sergentomyia squamirostris TaxID=3113639 RepID=A0AAT9G8I0_9RICK
MTYFFEIYTVFWTEPQKMFLAQLGLSHENPTSDMGNQPNEVVKAFTPVVSWNPYNLRVGPVGDIRDREPKNTVDIELTTNSEQIVIEDRETHILDKLTKLHSDCNPIWQKRGPHEKPWRVNRRDKQVTVSTLIRRNNDDMRQFNIETGEIQQPALQGLNQNRLANLGWIDSYFSQYTISAVKKILKLRLNNIGLKDVTVAKSQLLPLEVGVCYRTAQSGLILLILTCKTG